MPRAFSFSLLHAPSELFWCHLLPVTHWIWFTNWDDRSLQSLFLAALQMFDSTPLFPSGQTQADLYFFWIHSVFHEPQFWIFVALLQRWRSILHVSLNLAWSRKFTLGDFSPFLSFLMWIQSLMTQSFKSNQTSVCHALILTHWNFSRGPATSFPSHPQDFILSWYGLL